MMVISLVRLLQDAIKRITYLYCDVRDPQARRNKRCFPHLSSSRTDIWRLWYKRAFLILVKEKEIEETKTVKIKENGKKERKKSEGKDEILWPL